MFTLQVILKLLSSKLSTEDTLTYSKEAIKQEFNGSTSSKTCTLARNGDLVQEMYIVGDGSGNPAFASVEVEVGGQKIDKHYKAWMQIYDELFETNNGLKAAIEGTFLPLRFWFNRNPGLALPLIALQYHEVKVKVTFEDLANLIVIDNTNDFSSGASGLLTSSVTSSSFDLWCDYIYLDTDERRRFAQVSHEYLIEQLLNSQIRLYVFSVFALGLYQLILWINIRSKKCLD